MPPRDPYLTRVNRALKELGCGVAIEVAPSGKRLRLRSTLPFPDGSWKQRRITTPITNPAGLEQARKLAEELGRDIELHRMGLDRRLSGKKSTFGAGLNATCILPHWGDQWAKLRGTSVTDTKICIGILESLFRVTCLKAAKAFIGIEQNELDVPPAETYCDT